MRNLRLSRRIYNKGTIPGIYIFKYFILSLILKYWLLGHYARERKQIRAFYGLLASVHDYIYIISLSIIHKRNIIH